MKRWEVINEYIKKRGYTKYLEIGTQKEVCLQNVKCKYKAGVDPKPMSAVHHCEAFYRMTSDAFFKMNNQKFDIVFIDGLHEQVQVLRDFQHAVRSVRGGGVILLHDCNPISKERQMIPRISKQWNGDTWKAWIKIRRIYKDAFCINTDEGIGVVYPTEKAIFNDGTEDYETMAQARDFWLNLISVEQWKTLYL